MRQVLAPKTNGSKYLEELLGEYDLDFYIFFSSMVAVTGNGMFTLELTLYRLFLTQRSKQVGNLHILQLMHT